MAAIRLHNGWSYGGHLEHFGILGQKWGVRRFQNEDGTLTEEGKRRYYETYDKMEKKADENIARAKSQLADIEKNGWNARSAFDKGFVDQLRSRGDLNDENLKFFSQVFHQDIKDATLSKEVAQKAKSFIEKSGDIYLDNILDDFVDKVDKDDKTKLRDNTLNVSKEMGVETQYDMKIKLPEYTDKEKNIFKKNYSDKELTQKRDALKNTIERNPTLAAYGINVDKMLINGRPIKSMPLDEQCYCLYMIYINLS